MSESQSTTDTAVYNESNIQIDKELSQKISDFLGRKLELVAVEPDQDRL